MKTVEDPQSRWGNEFRWTVRIGIGAVLILLSVDTITGDLSRLLAGNVAPLLLLQATVRLVLLTMVFFWFMACHVDSRLFEDWLSGSPKTPQSGTILVFATISVATALCLLWLLVPYVQFFALASLFYFIVDSVLWIQQRKRITVVISAARDRVRQDDVNRLGALKVVEEYYFRRPHPARLAAATGAAAIVSSVTPWLSHEQWWPTVAYATLATTFVVSEAIIQYWRLNRDNKLTEYRERLHESAESTTN